MSHTPIATLLLAIVLNFSSCASNNYRRNFHNRTSESGQALGKLDQSEIDFLLRQQWKGYFEVAKAFIEKAQQKDSKGMLSLTSPITIKASGHDQSKAFYENQVIPKFDGVDIAWGQTKDIITDDRGNRGFVFSGKAYGPRSFPFYVTVMKEAGRLRVITITKKR